MPVAVTQSRWRRCFAPPLRSSTAAPLDGLALLEDRRLIDAAGSGWALFIGQSGPA